MDWCYICDAAHEQCEPYDMRYDCMVCFEPIEPGDDVAPDDPDDDYFADAFDHMHKWCVT